MGFVQEQENVENLYNKALRKYLRPELISRIDETLVFEELQPDDLLKIIPSIELQSRGGFGSQSDIVLRGSTFNQTLVLLDGMLSLIHI